MKDDGLKAWTTVDRERSKRVEARDARESEKKRERERERESDKIRGEIWDENIQKAIVTCIFPCYCSFL